MSKHGCGTWVIVASKAAGWDSMSDVLTDDELQFCHIQGYQPRIFRMEQGRDWGGRGPEQRGFDCRQGFYHHQDSSTFTSNHSSNSSTIFSERGSATPCGQFARPDQRRCTFLPDKQCEACKCVGHKAVNCDMLALALFIEHHKQSLSDAEHNDIKSKWIAC